jgi:tRNA-specific 2-thiouridylase
MAKEIGLTVANKPDSQEICFVDDNDYGRYISENTDTKIIPGYFVDTRGNIIGKHKGIVHYTIGQRKGLGLSIGKPVFVVDIDVENNRVIIGDNEDVFKDTLTARDMNWISIDKLTSEKEVTAKIRYSAKEAEAVVTPIGEDRVMVKFKEPVRAITPGQAVVFYDGDVVVGGGTIEK